MTVLNRDGIVLLDLVRVVVKTTDKYALLCSDSENESVVDSDEAEEGKDWDELEEEAKRYTAMTPDYCVLSVLALECLCATCLIMKCMMSAFAHSSLQG